MIKIAWIVQIIITLSVDVSIVMHFKIFNVISWLYALIFVAWSALTFCKIPLIIAAYNSQKIIWRIIFSVLIVVIIISEFETILQTLEMNHQLLNLEILNLEIWSYIILSVILSTASPLIAVIGIRYLNKSK